MKILLYSTVFYPMVGGVETVSAILAEGFIAAGHECRLVTQTENLKEDKKFPFEIYRKPSLSQKIELVKWADIILFNGASLALQPWILLHKKPFVWIHVGYQVSCIDGLGWVEGEAAPIKPWLSIKFHFKRKGFLFAVKEGAKLYLRRFFANYIVNKNVAITEWMMNFQPLRNQVVIHNPFPIEKFKKPVIAPQSLYDYIYVGRLVSEKGVSVLIKALAHAISISGNALNLIIIGDGNKKEGLVNLVKTLNLESNVTFKGKKMGQELVDLVYTAPIAIVPSEWYEPMGGVALELLAAGRLLIVSESGGLKECVGNAGLTFPNGDFESLAEKMIFLKENNQLQTTLKSNRLQVLSKFEPTCLINKYLIMFHEILSSK